MYRLTPEQQQIASNVAALADQHVAPYAAEIDKSDSRAPVVMAPTTDQAHDFIGRALCGPELFQ